MNYSSFDDIQMEKFPSTKWQKIDSKRPISKLWYFYT